MRKHQPKPTVTTSTRRARDRSTRELVIRALLRVTAFCTLVVRHHLGDERPAGRVVEGEHEAAGQRDEVEQRPPVAGA